jgi:hypothetical protein
VVARLRWREQPLDGAQVGAGFQQVGGEAMTKAVGRDRFGNAAASVRLSAGVLHRRFGDRAAGAIAREEPPLGPSHAPPDAQQLQQLGREHHVAVLGALALADPDDHAAAVDVLDPQGGDLGDPQPGGVGGPQQGAVLEAVDGGEEPDQFLAAEDDREPLGSLGADEVLEDPVAPQGDVVEEAEGLEVLVVVAPRGPPLADQVEQVGADVVGPEEFRGFAEVAREACGAVDVDIDGAGGEVAQAHVLDHAATERCHGVLPMLR